MEIQVLSRHNPPLSQSPSSSLTFHLSLRLPDPKADEWRSAGGREGGWRRGWNESREKWVSNGPRRSGMSCCRPQGVKITGFNGLERPRIRTRHFQKWEFEESEGRVKGGCCLKCLIFLIWKRALEIWEFLRCCFFSSSSFWQGWFVEGRIKWTPNTKSKLCLTTLFNIHYAPTSCSVHVCLGTKSLQWRVIYFSSWLMWMFQVPGRKMTPTHWWEANDNISCLDAYLDVSLFRCVCFILLPIKTGIWTHPVNFLSVPARRPITAGMRCICLKNFLSFQTYYLRVFLSVYVCAYGSSRARTPDLGQAASVDTFYGLFCPLAPLKKSHNRKTSLQSAFVRLAIQPAGSESPRCT